MDQFRYLTLPLCLIRKHAVLIVEGGVDRENGEEGVLSSPLASLPLG